MNNLPPDRFGANMLWQTGGVLEEVPWEMGEAGIVLLRNGGQAYVEPGDFVTLFRLPGRLEFVRVVKVGEPPELQSVEWDIHGRK